MNKLEKPNFTAWFVLQGLLATMHRPSFSAEKNDRLIYLRKILAKSAAEKRLLSWLIAYLPYSWQYKIGCWVTDPNRLQNFYLRKKEIEKQVRKLLLTNNIKQVVVLGSGLDVLPIFLADSFSNVNFIEIDMENTQSFKKSVFNQSHITIPENIEMVTGDLRYPLQEVLKASRKFKTNLSTLWLAEGLLMFLLENNIQKIFREIRNIDSNDSYCIFTTMLPVTSPKKKHFLVQDLYLKKERTPFCWTISPDKIEDYIGLLGYDVIQQIPYSALQEGYMKIPIDYDRLEESITIAKPKML